MAARLCGTPPHFSWGRGLIRIGRHRGREFELVVIGVAEHDRGVRSVRPAADAGVPDVELVEPVYPGLKRRAVGDFERDVVEAGTWCTPVMTGPLGVLIFSTLIKPSYSAVKRTGRAFSLDRDRLKNP